MTADAASFQEYKIGPEALSPKPVEKEKKPPMVRLKEIASKVEDRGRHARDFIGGLIKKDRANSPALEEFEEATGLVDQLMVARGIAKTKLGALSEDHESDTQGDGIAETESDTKDVKDEPQKADDKKSKYLGKIERQPIAENIIDLMTEDGVSAEGLAQLEERLRDSQGNALVIVHPFYQDGNVYPEILPMYKEYRKNLADMITTTIEQGLPVILLECDNNCNEDKLPNILNKLGMDDQKIFLVPTEATRPDPQNEVPLIDFASLLRKRGLSEITVIGTQFWKNSEDHFIKFGGCAGETIMRFDDAGVKATPGKAVLDRF